MTTSTRIAALLSRYGRTSEDSVKGWGFTQAEVDAAVKGGAVRRVGSQMGLTTIRYLSAV